MVEVVFPMTSGDGSLSAHPATNGEGDSAALTHASASGGGDPGILRHVLDHAPVVVWQIDQDGVFTYSDGRGLGTLGLTPGQVVGLSVFDLYRDDPQVVASLRKVLAGEEQQLLIQLQGVYFESWMRPLTNSAGEIRGAMGVASDVTGRIRAEDSERSSSERFLKAFHASPAGIMLTDLETGRIVDVNSALCRLLSFARDQLVGHTTLELGFWPDRATRLATLRNAIESHGQSRFNFLLPTAQGRPLDVKIVVEVIDLDGRACALSIIRDARRQQRMRRELRRTRRRYRTLARFAPVGIFHARRDGSLSYVNDHFSRLFAREASQLTGDGWWDAVATEDRETLRRNWDSTISARRSLSCEFRTNGGAEELWLLLQLEPETGAHGFVGSMTDISRRKRAELDLQALNQQLEQSVRMRTELLMRANKSLEEQIFERRRTYEELEKSEERWRSLVEEAPDVILLIDREGRIDYINHTQIRNDLEPEEVVSHSVYEFVLDRYHAEIDRVLQTVFEDRLPVTHEVQGPGADGDIRWFQSHLAPIQHFGKVIGATAIVRDVTTERRAHEELQQTQDQLAHARRVSMVGEMMAGFAHEIGQPLFAISSYIEGCLIRLQREGGIAEDVLDVLRESIAQAHRAIDVVRRLREFLQRQEIQRASADFNQIVVDAVQLADFGLRKYGVRCRLELDPGLPHVDVDRIQVMQVLLNLLLNAAEAMAGHGVVEGQVTVRSARLEPDFLLCEVSDIGPGLPPGSAGAIFDAFYTTKSNGLGLGLSISRSIVEAHGGRIVAMNNHHGVGARFEIQLPCFTERSQDDDGRTSDA